MKESIRQMNPEEEFYTPERCYLVELSNTPVDPELSIARARVRPGITTQWHRLDGINERYCIVSGEAQVETGKLPPKNVKQGDVVLIPSMCRQRITNIGTEDLVFLALCTPRFEKRCYQNLEESIPGNA